MRILTTIMFAGIATSQLGATDCGNALRDPGFDLWCGDQLCAWKVERGEAHRVATWNPGDPGVELVGDDVAIEQLSPVASTDTNCLEFSLIANIDLDASVVLNIDIYGDGVVERSELLPTSHWQPLSWKLPINGTWSGVRFELAKRGTGRAVLAQITAKVSHACSDALFSIDPKPAPLGAVCSADAGCASGLCAVTPIGRACAACDASHACPADSACGLADPTSPVRDLPHACVPLAARELGEPCLGDGECASGSCNYDPAHPIDGVPGSDHGTCSTCNDVHPCAGSETCGPAWLQSPQDPYAVGPSVCSPNQHARGQGEPCASDDDCTSSACSGVARQQCDDGRSCATAITCPFGGADTQNPLQNGPCNTVGVQGGSCQ